MIDLTQSKLAALHKDQTFVLSSLDHRNELAAAECESLCGVEPIAGVAMGGRTDRVKQSAYQHLGVEIIAQSDNFDSLCDIISRSSVELEGFHVKVIANDIASSQRREMVISLSNAIQGRPNLTEPLHRLILLCHKGEFSFGQLTAEPQRDYLQHDRKPHRTSTSLPSRMARGLVNLLPADTRTVLDPCCGTGSIPLEALAIGLQVYCGDRKPRMTFMTRANLRHFGHQPRVKQMDARDWTREVDAIVTDLPHGRYSHVADDVIEAILENAARIAKVSIIVAGENIEPIMRAAGFSRIQVYAVPKHSGFARYVHRGWP